MSARIKYAYLKHNTWMYRRSYPEAVAIVLGVKALKRSLRTGDVRTAQKRAAELNLAFERQVQAVLQGAQSVPEVATPSTGWVNPSQQLLAQLRSTLKDSGLPEFDGTVKTKPVLLDELARRYLIKRQSELRKGGFKSVRYAVELFSSKYGELPVQSLTRNHGREFQALVAQLSPLLGKSEGTYGMPLDAAVRWSEARRRRIKPVTQQRIWTQVTGFLDWVVYEGLLDQNPWRTIRFEQKVKRATYAVPTDDEVSALLQDRSSELYPMLMLCLLSGMRSGEAVGLEAADLVSKGNLGQFVQVRPNAQRLLKTDAAERLVPVHSSLLPVLERLPREGRLFPDLDVNIVTKRFSGLRSRLKLNRPGLVFHSTRKWFITQCERTGVPEHFTASLVGHSSARSENGITYSIYSAGIGDDQKRRIVDQIRLPEGVTP